MSRRLSNRELKARELEDLVAALDRMTAGLNRIKGERECKLQGAARWMLGQVVDERNRVADRAKSVRAGAAI